MAEVLEKRTASQALLDRFKEAKDLPSDYAAADALKVTRQAVSNWRSAYSGMDDATVVMIAETLDIDPFAVLAQVKFERAKTERERRVWRRYCARVLLAFVGAGIFTSASGPIIEPASAQVIRQPIHYTHLAILHWLKRHWRPSENAERGRSVRRSPGLACALLLNRLSRPRERRCAP